MASNGDASGLAEFTCWYAASMFRCVYRKVIVLPQPGPISWNAAVERPPWQAFDPQRFNSRGCTREAKLSTASLGSADRTRSESSWWGGDGWTAGTVSRAGTGSVADRRRRSKPPIRGSRGARAMAASNSSAARACSPQRRHQSASCRWAEASREETVCRRRMYASSKSRQCISTSRVGMRSSLPSFLATT